MKSIRPLSRLVLVASALAIAGSGCADRLHMTPGHGQSVAGAMAAQKVNPDAGRKSKPQSGFDSQEASIVAKNYRQSLTAKGTQADDKGMLILAPSAAQQPLLPSVPDHK
jgi:hypothetical protein